MSGADQLLVETVERLLTTVCTPVEVERAEADGWSAVVWGELAQAGFPWVGIPAGAGGSDGTLLDVAAILRGIGAHAAPVPVAETALLAGWLLAGAGLALPAGPATVIADGDAVAHHAGRLRVTGATVPWARHAERIVTVVEVDGAVEVVSLRRDQLTISPGSNLAGEARDGVDGDVGLDDVERAPLPDASGPQAVFAALRARGALSRVLMSAGALGTMAQMTIDYTNDRRQFGKPVASFQAVQHHLVTVAQCSVRAQIAADVATRETARGSDGIEIAAARVIVDDAIALATRAAHQAHGAIGVTREYPLHQLSRRLWSWRHEYGSTSSWRRELGRRVHAAGADGLFPLITA